MASNDAEPKRDASFDVLGFILLIPQPFVRNAKLSPKQAPETRSWRGNDIFGQPLWIACPGRQIDDRL